MIYFFIGTKAQLIKTAPVMRELQKQNINYTYIHSGQHQETIDLLLKNFAIKKPDFILHYGKDITKPYQLFLWAIKIFFIALFKKKSIIANDPNPIIVNHGDTFSALIGSVFAKIIRSKNVHLESGLRSFNLLHPFPEEITRIAIFSLTDIYFSPDSKSLENLKKYKGIKVNTKQNTMYDATQLALKSDYCAITIPEYKYAIISIHRYENIFKKEQLINIVEIIEQISKQIKIIFILHKPTKQQLLKHKLINLLEKNPQIELYPRQDYFTFVKLISNAEFLVTDGGSNQEESYYLGIPCLLLRKTTERDEELAHNVVLSRYSQKIIEKFLVDYKSYKKEKLKVKNSPSKIIIKSLLDLVE